MFHSVSLFSQAPFAHGSRALPTIFDVKTFFHSLSVSQRNFLSQVCVIYKVLMPATNATSEKSFSTLCLVKTYLRNTMGQERLNKLMILLPHRKITDSLDLDAIANEFIVNSEHRRKNLVPQNNFYSLTFHYRLLLFLIFVKLLKRCFF